MEALILVATSGGPTTFARIGVMRALNGNRRAGVRSRRAKIEGSVKEAGSGIPATNVQDRLRGSEYFLPAFNIQATVEMGNQVNSPTFNL